MLPEKTEYGFVLFLCILVTLSLFGPVCRRLFSSLPAWLTFFVFLLLCTTLDYFAIAKGWWSFPEEKTLGLKLLTVPIEEYILFALFFIITLSFWEATRDGVE